MALESQGGRVEEGRVADRESHKRSKEENAKQLPGSQKMKIVEEVSAVNGRFRIGGGRGRALANWRKHETREKLCLLS